MSSHTATGEWKSFETRMRRRRAERLLSRAAAAADAGDREQARACLDEVQRLAPALPAVAALRQQLESAPAEPAAWRRSRSLILAGTSAAAITLGTAAVFLGSGAARPLPARDLAGSGSTVVITSGLVERSGPALSDPPTAPEQPRPSNLELARAPEPAPPQIERPDGPSVEPIDLSAGLVAAPAPDLAAPVGAAVPASLLSSNTELEPPAPAESEPAPSAMVRRALDRYAAAYSALDAAAAQRVFPRVNRGALAQAFDAIASQRISLGTCRIDVAGDAALAVCAGSATWAAKIGSTAPRTEARRWTFDLARAGTAWEIVNARVQNK